MSNAPSPIIPLTISALLAELTDYTIPIYQRNYAWAAPEIEQLIQDVIDYAKSSPDKRYYIGTLVVSADTSKARSAFITVDGQQRLTTLFILHAVLRQKYGSVREQHMKLRFQCRPLSDDTLQAIANGNIAKGRSAYATTIMAAYDICQLALEDKLTLERIDIATFMHYFYEHVVIFRVGLRQDTDLNHYFEIMNSRGEQLEKHEVLKARLMGVFNNDVEGARYRACFARIWVACSNMNRYVQHSFPKQQRHYLFGDRDWNKLTIASFDDLVSTIHPEEGIIEGTGVSLSAILSDSDKSLIPVEQDDDNERFHSVINFPNFLLQVLQLEVGTVEIPLDDKRLLDLFQAYMPDEKDERITFVKSFIFHLLKYRFLFDKYVIKREFSTEEDRWSLKCLRWYSPKPNQETVGYVNTFEKSEGAVYSDNRRILMLLSMFHVSHPMQSSKRWLHAALWYLSQQSEVHAEGYVAYLERIAKSFVYDLHLATDKQNGYLTMIHQPVFSRRAASRLDPDKLRFGVINNNLIFNFLDYLLWSKHKDTNNRIRCFEYTFRHSKEHYYPQQPTHPEDIIAEKHLHAFGNLCLISHERNAQLNNALPVDKRKYYSNDKPIDSIKLYLMMQYPHWHIKEIEEHEEEMLDLLKAHM
ncbi:DUF262 domain-containing HNH endonuclease family protein [Chitinophaga pendula]|uniref:GmrSD restriction endonuclease domain-containing protein n=1 Tax=Chitinophaga TaxID=79328 RepID=UPI000BAED68B|nr:MULTISPECIES: DUF262 domain-containing protein [Chitinophaga]ASZ11038.1 hypothetical protein CK934_08720 [Chitinophaga sp. MD30]UCJ05965.1 DUF262 domain-containing HNH endonuclease family protein [Chitinophaga pendula]